MIRFILKNRFKDPYCSEVIETIKTIDVDIPELESQLKKGGIQPDQFDLTDLIGVEVLKTSNKG